MQLVPNHEMDVLAKLSYYTFQMCVYRTSLAAADVNLLYNDPSIVLLP